MTNTAVPEINPANATPAVAARAERKRVPMSVPRQKLAVPEIPGFVCYWHLESNVGAALQAAYEFVKTDEVDLVQTLPANALGVSGNMDMGTNISMMGNK